ncbi:MAG: DUF1269 domain-containing protein [Actinobacteria bacterium]|nr:DUF1269 domain-containing protein [Actinomycetota bacterium]
MTTLQRTGRAPAAGTAPPHAGGAPRRHVVVIAFPDVFRAHEAMLAAARLERRLSIVLNDAAVVTRDAAGRVRVNRGGRPSPAAAALGAFAAAGLPLQWVVGTWIALAGGALAALVAGLWSRRAVGFTARTLRRLGTRLEPGGAAGCFLVSHGHLAHVLAEVRRFDGRLLETTLPGEVREQLAEALAAP